MKRVLTIQDISCVGKCSLTVALPILSAMGLETVILPTAVLSTHTAFPGAYVKSLTEIIKPVTEHWKEQKITFDSISCGYLGSVSQMMLIKQIFQELKTAHTKIVLDPVMGDEGRLYRGFDMEFVENMKRFCRESDVLLPNMTEAAYLLGKDYRCLPKDRKGCESLVWELTGLNDGIVVLKGAELEKGKVGVFAADARTGEMIYCERERLPVNFSGTGDIFATVCQGELTKGVGLTEMVELAMDFVLECVRKTWNDETHRWYGVNFEEGLPLLIERMVH